MVGAEVKLILQFLKRSICGFWAEEKADFVYLFRGQKPAEPKPVRKRHLGHEGIWRG
jgi:hypothetical protein